MAEKIDARADTGDTKSVCEGQRRNQAAMVWSTELSQIAAADFSQLTMGFRRAQAW
jgi:hypothetical protein